MLRILALLTVLFPAIAFATDSVGVEIVNSTNVQATVPEPFPSMYSDRRTFLEAIHRERPKGKQLLSVTGITVPHHLVAADLIARAFWAASETKFDRVIILSPDHFSRSGHAFATTLRAFETALGHLETDTMAVQSLLQRADIFEKSDLFTSEHGIGAELPFVAWFFPRAQVVPIVISVSATQKDWEEAITALRPLITPSTLIVQSTEFSHYLSSDLASQRDQETLNVLSAQALDGILALRQSDHLDSKGAQYIQMRLQSLIGATGPVVIANRNSSEYSHLSGRTTSYIVQLFGPNASKLSIATYADQHVTYFGGDVLLGRHLIPLLADRKTRKSMLAEILNITRGRPLIVNLEGMILKEWPLGVADDAHIMPVDLAAPVMRSLHVVGAGLANNHSFDLGPVGLEETISSLKSLHITPIRHGEIVDFGDFRLLAVNLISKHQIPGFPVADEKDLANLCAQQARPPLLAFVHWGTEYRDTLNASEHSMASKLLDCGILSVIGAHSHLASKSINSIRGGMQQVTYSLGNMLFDQNGAIASGMLLELRTFKQGTFAARLIPLPNLFDLGRSLISGYNREPVQPGTK